MPKKDERQLRNAKAVRSEPTGPEAQPTGPEAHLWHYLRAKRFNGVKFT